MSGRKPRRIRWPATANTMALVCQRVALVTPAELAEVMAPLHAASRALREGVATEWQWSVLASSINAAMAVEKQGVVKGLHEHLHAAELALQGIYRRAMQGGTWRPTALYYLELDVINTAVDLHEFQLKQLSHGEVIRALDYAQAEVRSSGGKAIRQPTPQHQEQLA